MFPGSELQFMANVNYSRQAKILEGLTGSVYFLIRPSTSGGSNAAAVLCMEIHGGYRVFECAERSFNPHMKWYISLIASVADVPVVASQFGMQVFLFL